MSEQTDKPTLSVDNLAEAVSCHFGDDYRRMFDRLIESDYSIQIVEMSQFDAVEFTWIDDMGHAISYERCPNTRRNEVFKDLLKRAVHYADTHYIIESESDIEPKNIQLGRILDVDEWRRYGVSEVSFETLKRVYDNERLEKMRQMFAAGWSMTYDYSSTKDKIPVIWNDADGECVLLYGANRVIFEHELRVAADSAFDLFCERKNDPAPDASPTRSQLMHFYDRIENIVSGAKTLTRETASAESWLSEVVEEVDAFENNPHYGEPEPKTGYEVIELGELRPMYSSGIFQDAAKFARRQSMSDASPINAVFLVKNQQTGNIRAVALSGRVYLYTWSASDIL